MTALGEDSGKNPVEVFPEGKRLRSLHLFLFYSIYFVAGGLGQGLALIPGVAITFWPPVGILIATLLLNSRSTWPGWLLAGCLAELSCNAVWFQNPLHFALVYYAGNALEALTATWLLRRFCGVPFQLKSPQEVTAFVLLGAGVAPMVSATVIASVDAWIGKHPFATAWPLVWLGDASGLLVATPLTFVVIQAWRRRASLPPRRLLEAVVLGLSLVAIAGLSLSGRLPTAYMTLPPLLWAALRFQLKGAATAIALITLISAIFTATGSGEFTGQPELLQSKIVMLQTFLAISSISGLLVGALSQQRQEALHRLQIANSQLEARVAERTDTLRASEAFARHLADVAPCILYIFNLAEKRNVWGNREMISALRYTREEIAALSGELIETLMHPGDLQHYRVHLTRIRTLQDGETLDLEYRFRRADGSWMWIHSRDMVFQRNAAGCPTQIIGAALDITARKETETSLQEAHAQLSDRAVHLESLVQQRTARLNEIVGDLEAFSYSLVHDMRAPLRAMQSFAQMLAGECGQGETTDQYVRLIRTAAERMDALIRDGLQYSRVMRVELPLLPVDLGALIRGMIETYPAYDAANARIEVEGSLPLILGNEATLTQCVSNLLGNAIKFVAPGVLPRVRIWSESHNGRARVFFKDNGVGIAEDHHQKIFQIFQRLNPKYDGTGIGLAIVKKAAERMGGTVGMESQLGQGSTFWLELATAENHTPTSESG